VYNARLALAAAGRPAVVELHPDPADRDLVARLTPGAPRPPTYAESELHAVIGRRYSNRGPYWPDPVPADVRVALLKAARDEWAWLDLLVGMTALTAFSEIAYSADRVLRRDARYQAEFAAWTHADRSPDHSQPANEGDGLHRDWPGAVPDSPAAPAKRGAADPPASLARPASRS